MILYFYKCNHLTASKSLQLKKHFLVLPPKTKIHTCNADYIIKREIALTKTDQLAVQYTSSVTRSHDRFLDIWLFHTCYEIFSSTCI